MNSLKTFSYSTYLLSTLFLVGQITGNLFAQNCSFESITANYWQYRQNLNKHFVLNDIDPTGCVGDGIGLSSESADCTFDKSGYGIPATSIVMGFDGGNGMFDRNDKERIPEWYDPACADAGPDRGTHHSGVPTRKFNYLEYGSETPHQMGQYWGVLSTEYALLKQNHQDEAAQKTLDELFLALQAYRRLDMQAQCQVKKRYDEIQTYFEVSTECDSDHIPLGLDPKSCLCTDRYIAGLNHPNFPPPSVFPIPKNRPLNAALGRLHWGSGKTKAHRMNATSTM